MSGFIDVGGARLLVAAARELAPERQLVIHHPPRSLARILEIGWAETPGLRLDDADCASPARS